ncbi:LUD domain-containing protein [Sphingobacterium corticibacterium]|uniref:Lactate utilization protein n=1 Tax=Sphingobacterium corticibacterium TaxID=2484746 RepID=A0A4Q6XPU5_9SPHI|nr:LUD domain-containing protein [Sphingobacterium corticibacterium]RZF59422.1 lactate utilization protein [Sphingobacterium corticibacterium]
MGEQVADKFLKDSAVKSFDQRHREIINTNIEKYRLAFERSRSKFFDLENSKKKAHLIKWKTIENLERYLLDFESNFTKRGGQVIWANDAEEARNEIFKIMERHQAKSIVKSKSMAIEEIELHHFLKKQNIEIFECDFDTPSDASAEQMTIEGGELLRQKYTKADIGISGANFIIADTGSIAITENDGNARLTTSFSKVHIALVGIEKIIPSIVDLDLFWPLVASHGTGQNLTVYNTILGGSRQEQDTDGPEEMYVILLDNGRTNILEKNDQRQALYCICGEACLNLCPTYQNIAGQTYDTTYQILINSLVPPSLNDVSELKNPAYASPLCGKCFEACAVNIDYLRLALLNRRDSVQQGLIPQTEKRVWKVFTYAIQRRGLIDFFSGRTKNFFLRRFLRKTWSKHLELPKLAEKSFSKQWKERKD